MSRKGLTILYIPQKQGKRSVQIHLSYMMALLISSVLLLSGMGLSFLVWESAQVPNTNELLAETLELGQSKREFEEDLQTVERRIALLEIYAMQAQKEEDGGPLGILHESIEVTLPIRPFLTSPIFKSNKIKGYGKEEAFQGSYFPSHQGVDYFAVRGSSVYSACAGVVEGVYQDDVYGTHILLAHDFGFSTMYAHLSKSLVAEGEWLTSGAIIGLVGDSGQSSGAHLHFELLFGGSPIDPIAYFVSP